MAKLQEKKDKFKYGLGGLQGLQYGPPLRDHNYNGKGRFRFSCKFLQGYLKPRLNKLSKKKIICFIKQSMNKWKTNLYADGMLLMALAQIWKFKMRNRKLVVSSTGASLKHQLS